MVEIPGFKKAKIIKKEYINKAQTALLITFEHAVPSKFSFKPGQFISIQVAENTYRAYSLCSSPSNTSQFQIVLTVDKPGLGAEYLKNSSIGDEIKFIGPSGRFYLTEPYENNIVFVATSTGIAPFISMFHILESQKNNLQSNIHVIFGVRTREDLFFEEELKHFKKTLNSFSYTICLSQEQSSDCVSGRVSEEIKNINLNDSQFYICGNPNMVEDVKEYFSKQSIPIEKMFFEKFTVTKPKV